MGYSMDFVPQSWALDLVKRPPLVTQRFGVTELMEYLDTLYRILRSLQEFSLKPSHFYSFGRKGTLNVLARGVLILRICRLVVLVANNTNFTPPMKEDARQRISNMLTGSGEVHRSLCDKLVQTTSWGGLEDIIMRCPLNRGTDKLVRLSLRKGNKLPQPPSKFIRLVLYNKVPELNQLLSLTSSVQRFEPALNPQAESFNPSKSLQTTSTNQTGTHDPEKDTEFEDGDTTGLMHSDHEAVRFDAPPESHTQLMHTLTTREVESGKKILFAYRQYILRKQAGQQSAVETIWRCYSRYLRRRDSPRSPADERYLKFQGEYKKDIKIPDAPGPLPDSFYRHKAILLGCMPYVAIYLRGLERVNQQQKQENRKRLQTAHHRHLEEIQNRMDICSRFTTSLKKMSLVIMPGSNELHNRSALRRHVKELEGIHREMGDRFGGDSMPATLEQHRRRGVAIILAQPI